eukprot:866697_1
MEDEGWTDPNYWKDLDEDTMRSDLGMRKGHITRFKGEHEKWCKRDRSKPKRLSKSKKKRMTQRPKSHKNEKPKKVTSKQLPSKKIKNKATKTEKKAMKKSSPTEATEASKPVELKDKLISNETITIQKAKIR